MAVELCFEARDHSRQIHAEELAQRLVTHFPSTVVDWQRGTDYVQAGLDRLIALGTPDVILQSHRAYFGNVVYVSVSEPAWAGALATSFVHSVWSPLMDGVVFEIEGVADPAMMDAITRELGTALDMELALEAPEEDDSDME